MDFRNWLERATMSIGDWATSPKMTVLTNIIAPKSSAVESDAEWETCPPEVREFYETAAGACDLSYKFSIPREYTIKTAGVKRSYFPKRMVGGVQLFGLAEALKIKRELSAVIAAAGRNRNATALKQVTSIAESAYPLWKSLGSDCLVLVPGDAEIPTGVYLLSFPLLLEPDRYVKYADSFEEWLTFLEESFYLGPDWSYLELFHNGRKLEVNASLREEIRPFVQ